MVSVDLTQSFKDLVAERKTSYPPSKRSKSPFRSKSPNRKGKGKQVEEDEEFLKEAYRIHTHLGSLSTLLKTIRKPYLSISSAPSRLNRASRQDVSESSELNSLDKWRDSKHLTDRERDEIDLRGRMILRRCKDRVVALEDMEKARQKAILPKPVSSLYTLLPSLAPADGDSAIIQNLVTAHRANIIWTLNDLLAKLSAGLTDLQEERSKRREERTRTLGGQAAKEAAAIEAKSKFSLFAPTSVPSSSSLSNGPALPDVLKGVIPDDEPPIESQLTPEQLQLFSNENNTLLEHMQSQLDSVLSAEKSLLEISALQTELVKHLMTQTEITDRLYDEAVGSVGDVGKANEQLKKARQRNQEGRLFLLVFLFGASMALLFLDWYA
ncbi:snare-complex protein syntaxin-18 N-terminus-domain-containing protein [Kockovaella imperatae]|uniref:Snare-complex protein syntaxin-18 N-terminus-domain-containing protein n=1 Tax=Kockovaella imperatae TaxID=4999 RepID=A0A1Y1UMP9_9TREE|nr:snare-complex protein syntaxin-18 N-terminus-domain-containing protein [Kockovaella imperatae]ORX39330.1 snare-complex protein syntaxin-18 N-terminus-domain-containing protein [Kockovaella imperatae]